MNTGLVKGLGALDATTIVMGSMIGSGIFIVSADMARIVNSPGLPKLIGPGNPSASFSPAGKSMKRRKASIRSST